MSCLILPSRFVSQPPYNAPIDWGSPIARGLVRLANAGLASDGGLLDSVDPTAIYTSASPAIGYNNGGKVVAKNSSTQWICSKTHPAIGTGDHTIFGVSLNRSNNTDQTICRIASTNMTGTIRLSVLSTTARVTNFNGTIATAPTASHIVSRLECLVATRRNGTYYFFMNGQSLGSASGPSTVANQPFTIGGNSDQSEVNLAGLFLRGLSDDEALSLSVNPWQLYKAPPRRIWAPGAAGGFNSAWAANSNVMINGGAM